MTKEQFNRAMTQAIVSKSISEIRKDPERAIRKLVDIGQETAGGRLQQKFMEMAHQMLKMEHSPYYTLVRNIVAQVDEERLLTFGMNLGWDSLTQGAKQIRRNEAALGFNIPWSLTIHLAQTEDSPSIQDYLRLIFEGVKLGINSFFLLPEDEASTCCALELIEAYHGCAFCLLIPAICNAAKLLKTTPAGKNSIVGVNSAAVGWAYQVDFLRAEKYPYLIWRTYGTQEDVRDILSGDWAKQILPYAGVAAVLLAHGGDKRVDDAQVYTYALEARMKQRYPTLMLDFYHDILYTDVCISGDPCFLGVLPNGQVTEYRRGCEVPVQEFVQDKPLMELLKRFPKRTQEG